jgi:hypothetical protein
MEVQKFWTIGVWVIQKIFAGSGDSGIDAMVYGT